MLPAFAFYKFCTKPYATPLFDATKTDNRFKLNKKLVFGLHKKTFYFSLSCLKCYGRMKFLLR